MNALESYTQLRQGHEDVLIDREEALRCIPESSWRLYSDWRKKRRCAAKAASVPLPGPTLGSFMDKSIKVEGESVSRLLPAHIIVLQKCESKILGLISADKEEREAAVSLSTEEDADIAYIFTQPIKDVFEIAANGGQKAIREQSKTILLEWPQEKLRTVCFAVLEQIKRYAEAQVKLVSDLKEKGDITFFQEPERTPATKTEAAGS